MSIIKFKVGETTKVTLDFESGKKIDGDYGTQFQYGCNNGDDIFYATPTLATLIDQITDGDGKGKTIEIGKINKQGPDGKTIPIFTVNGKTMDDLARPNTINQSPIGAGFAHKDTKASSNLSMADLDYRISLIEQRLEKIDGTKVVRTDAEAELPF